MPVDLEDVVDSEERASVSDEDVPGAHYAIAHIVPMQVTHAWAKLGKQAYSLLQPSSNRKDWA